MQPHALKAATVGFTGGGALQAVIPSLVALAVLCVPALTFGQTPPTTAEIYGAWCAPCHGPDGTGRVPNPTVKTPPMDFSECRLATREPDADWELVIREGGPAAGLSSEMPSFGDSLTRQDEQQLVAYLRAFCREPDWPHGNANYPRPILTEKAFPEDEVVILPVVSHRPGERTRLRLEAVYERRVHRRGHVEIRVPAEAVGWIPRGAVGVGDISLGGKFVLHADPDGTRIVTGGLELKLPTGNTTFRFGEGTAVVEPYVAAGTSWRGTYVQVQLKAELPVRQVGQEDTRHLVYNVYVGRDLTALPTSWTVGVEVNGVDRALAITPQVRKVLTRTAALAAAGGVRIPVTNPAGRQFTRWVGYLMWEYRNPVRPRP